MSINQAAIHFNLPYSSLYGRFKRGKYSDAPNSSDNDLSHNNTNEHSPDNSIQYAHHTLIEAVPAQMQDGVIYQQHYTQSPQIIHQQPPPQIYHQQHIIYQTHPQPPQILHVHQIKKETSWGNPYHMNSWLDDEVVTNHKRRRRWVVLTWTKKKRKEK